MPAEKTIAVSFRVSPRFKQLIKAAAAREHLSQTNMLESLLYEYCARHAVVPEHEERSRASTSAIART